MVNLANFDGPQFKPNEPGPGGHGQQGTLFSNRRLNAANRTGDEVGHKGFSQNRLNAVRQLVHVDLNAAGDTVPINRALNGHYTAEEARGGWPNSTASRAEREAIATDMTRDTIHQTIARSTVPMSTLARDRRVAGGTAVKGTQVGVNYIDNGAAGNYSPTGGNITVDPRHVEGSTLIHELGHQQDWHSQALANLSAAAERRSDGLFGRDAPEPPSAVRGERSGATQLGSPENFAKVEGFADAFADRHAREHPKADPDMPDDPGDGYSRYRDDQWAAYSGSEDTHPAEFGPIARVYTDTRREHGGLDLRSKNFQQLQFGRHIQGVVDINDRSWEPALGQQVR